MTDPALSTATPRQNWRRPSRRHCLTLALTGLGMLTVLAPLVQAPRPRFIWNASASAPIGLYRVSPQTPIRRGDRVIAWAPPFHRQLAATRDYLPLDVPLIKRVVAMSGDPVCARGQAIFVADRWVARRLSRDPTGRPMPAWSGCFILGERQLFLLGDGPQSFDGRYFGASAAHDLIGKATLLWAR